MLRRMIGTFLALQAAMLGVAWACSCDEPGTAEELLVEHDAAFVGRGVETRGGGQGFVRRAPGVRWTVSA